MLSKEVNINVPITAEFVDSILTTAFEGGSNYWIDKILPVDVKEDNIPHFSDYISKGKELIIVDNEWGNHNSLTLDKFVEGFKKYVHNKINFGMKIYTDLSDYDAEEADSILQFAIFNEVVFG